MKVVVWRGSIAGVFLYASVGVFGYLTFYNRPEELMKQNILIADYGINVAIILVTIFQICILLLFLGAILNISIGLLRNASLVPSSQGDS
jgi:hypothetical protein